MEYASTGSRMVINQLTENYGDECLKYFGRPNGECLIINVLVQTISPYLFLFVMLSYVHRL